MELITRHARNNLGSRDSEEGDPTVVGNGICQGCFAAAWGPMQQHPPWGLYPQPSIYLMQINRTVLLLSSCWCTTASLVYLAQLDRPQTTKSNLVMFSFDATVTAYAAI